MPIHFPGESKDYRTVRNKLLTAEIKLRNQIEEVAALRRSLPQGGEVVEEYIFEEIDPNGKIVQTKLSDLFGKGKNTLIIYGMMFHPDHKSPCVMCNSIVDGLNGQSMHVNDRVNLVVVSKATMKKLQQWAASRNWNNLRLLSSFHNTYNLDYLAEDEEGNQMPMLNVFHKKGKKIFHFYGTEMLYASSEKGQDTRHVDLIWPLWNLFDLTPEGRGEDWYPGFEYKK